MRRYPWALALIYALLLSGCFAWTEDSRGNLTSVGLPGVPLWQSAPNAANAQPIRPSDLGFTQEETASIGGPVLVMPPVPPATAWRYRYYQSGQNHCQADLDKLMAQRAASGATGPAPYCTENPTAPPSRGSAFVF